MILMDILSCGKPLRLPKILLKKRSLSKVSPGNTSTLRMELSKLNGLLTEKLTPKLKLNLMSQLRSRNSLLPQRSSTIGPATSMSPLTDASADHAKEMMIFSSFLTVSKI